MVRFQRAGLGRVIAAEVGGLAHLGDGVRHGPAGLARDQLAKPLHGTLQQIRGPLQHCSARRSAGPRPFRRRCRCGGHRILNAERAGLRDVAHNVRMVCRIDNRPMSGSPKQERRGNNRRGFQILRAGVFDSALQRFAHARIGKVQARRIPPLRAEQILRQHDDRMGRAGIFGRFLDRIGDEIGDGRFLVRELMNEGAVRAVLQKPAHEISEQRLMRADRGIDTARPVQIALANDMPI